MFIDKFNAVVKIDSDHPLAIAQQAKGSAPSEVPSEVPSGRRARGR